MYSASAQKKTAKSGPIVFASFLASATLMFALCAPETLGRQTLQSKHGDDAQAALPSLDTPRP